MGGPALEFLHMPGGVPLMEDLGGMCATTLLADPVPAVAAVCDVGGEMAQRGPVAAQHRVAQLPDREQIPEILLHMGRRPMPRKFIPIVHEPANIPDELVNRPELQVA